MPISPLKQCAGNKKKKKWKDPTVPERCQFYCEEGSGYCKFHGGRSMQEKNPRFRGGTKGFLAKLPEDFARRIEAAMDDPELTSLRPHIAVIEERITDLYDKLWTKESTDAWLAVHEQQVEATEALAALTAALPPDVAAAPGFAANLTRLTGLLAGMAQEFDHVDAERRTWQEWKGLVEDHRRLVETETKREAQLQASLSARQTMTLFAAIHIAIAEELAGVPELKMRLGARLGTLLLNRRPVPRAELLPRPAETVEAEVLPPDDDPATAAASGSVVEG